MKRRGAEIAEEILEFKLCVLCASAFPIFAFPNLAAEAIGLKWAERICVEWLGKHRYDRRTGRH